MKGTRLQSRHVQPAQPSSDRSFGYRDRKPPRHLVTFGIYNLLNEHPQMVGDGGNSAVEFSQKIIPMDGITLQAMLQYTF